MDTRYLHTLFDVVDGGSLAEAARRQNLTAAAVGQRLKALENELGVPLVQRSGATVQPTAPCLRILPRLRSIIADVALLASDMADDGLAGPYRLGIISTALGDHGPALVEHLRTIAPNVELSITPGASAYLFEQLSAGELYAAILVQPNFDIPKRMTIETLEYQSYCWVTPKDCKSDNLPLIVYDRNSWGGKIAWRWIEKNLTTPKVLCELDAPETVAHLVAGGAGRAILPIWEGLSAMVRIQIKPLHDFPKRPVIFLHGTSAVDQACRQFFGNSKG